MKSFNPIIYIAGVCLALASCKTDIEAPDIDKGSLDASKYVAVGNSITAGYADNALYYEGQQVSYAKMLSDQFKRIGGGDFKQPLVEQTSVGIGASGGPRLVLRPSTDCKDVTSLAPVPIAAVGDASVFASNIYASAGPFNNMGVPGAKAITTLYSGYGNPGNGIGKYNPFYMRMASNPSSSSILSDQCY